MLCSVSLIGVAALVTGRVAAGEQPPHQVSVGNGSSIGGWNRSAWLGAANPIDFFAANWYGALNIVLAIVVVVFAIRRGWLKGSWRPGTQSQSGSVRDVTGHPASIWLLCGILVWSSALVAGSLVIGLGGWSVGQASLRSQALLMGCSYGLSLLVGAFLLYLVHASAPRAGLSCSPKSVLVGMLLLLVAWPLVTVASIGAGLIHQLIGGTMPDAVAHPTLQMMLENKHDPWAWMLVGLAIVAAPVQEEIIYRGFLQSALLRISGSVWVAIGVSSLIFAAAHVVGTGVVPWYAAVALFVLSIVIGVAFERTGRLGVAIGIHVAFNAANVVLALLVSPS